MKQLAVLSPSPLVIDTLTEGAPEPWREGVQAWASVAEMRGQADAPTPDAIVYDLAPGTDVQGDLRALGADARFGRAPVLVIHPPTQAAAARDLEGAFDQVTGSLAKPFAPADLFARLNELPPVAAAAPEPEPDKPKPTMDEIDPQIVETLPGVTDAFIWSPNGSMEHASSPRAAQLNTTMSFALQLCNRIGAEVELGEFSGLNVSGPQESAGFFSVLTDRNDRTRYRTFGVITDNRTDPDAVSETLQQRLLK